MGYRIRLSNCCIAIIVVAVLLGIAVQWMLITRPEFFLNPGTPLSELWDRLWGRTIGYRGLGRYPNGSVAYKDVRRTTAPRMSPHGGLLVKGDYYDLEGRKRSTVRDGTGVAMFFTSNGVLKQMASYVNGIRCGPQIFWTKQGNLSEYRYYDIQGRSHGIRYGFHENGERRRETLFDDYGQMLYDKYWHENGSLVTLLSKTNAILDRQMHKP